MEADQQKKAIEKTTGPCLIMAGAGTGKTHTIVEKIAYLVSNKIYKPSEILCLTFSNEATNNLKLEIDKKLKNSSGITVRTFHGFCADIIKEFGEKIGIDPGFEILLPDDAKVMIFKNLDVGAYYAKRYEGTISTAKDFGISEQDIEGQVVKLRKKVEEEFKTKDIKKKYNEFDLELKTLYKKLIDFPEDKKIINARKKELVELIFIYDEYSKYADFLETWKKYNELKKQKNLLDYSDLNYNVIKLFNKFGAGELANRYKYILIDEFQDTNKLQFELIEHLALYHKNITIVGDPNQSIYGFRGAYRESFNHFKEAFSITDKDIFVLDKSRRSPNTVLRIAHDLIKNNYDNPNECFEVLNFENREGDKVKVLEMKNSDEEARKIAELVEEEIELGTPLNEICVLYRTHRQSKAIKQSLEAKKIPIIFSGSADLMQKPEIRTAIAYLSLLNNLRERTGTGEQSWWDLFHYHNALTPEDSIKIGRYLKKKKEDNVSIDLAVLGDIKSIGLSEDGEKIMQRVVDKLKILVKLSNKALPDLILDIYEITGLNRAFSTERTIGNIEAMMNLKIFYDIAEKYYTAHAKDIGSFIKYIEIMDDLDVTMPASKITSTNAVRMMTIHSVKGLQFDTVILSNMAQDRFPLTRTRNEPLIPKELNPDIKRYIDTLEKLDESELRVKDKSFQTNITCLPLSNENLQNKFSVPSKSGEDFVGSQAHCCPNINDTDYRNKIKDFEHKTLEYEERRLCYVGFTRAKKKLILTFAKSYNREENSSGPSQFLNEITFKDNMNMLIEADNEEKCTVIAPCSKFEQYKILLKKQLIDSLDSDDLNTLLSRMLLYHAVREGKVNDFTKIKFDEIISKKELDRNIEINRERCSCVDFDRDNFTFSPTALIDYNECPKKYELQHIFQMPERGAFGWSGASTGSFIHKLFEDGVRGNFTDRKQFVDHALVMSKLAEWKGIDLEDAEHLIDVFWERHNGKYDKKSLVEQELRIDIEGFRFFGKADRIDFITGNKIAIIDYKTNKDTIEPKKRAWQLGFYALAAKNSLGLTPVRLVLEMLRLEKPIEGIVDDKGNVKAGRSEGFNIEEVRQELLECAKKIVRDYEGEFKPTEDESKCMFCGYKFYCPKWKS